ncbi:MAG TPA: type II toxin-antitoxin system HicA family toxin [Candidatus Ozemobacteraceae bacterium]|nr:type II toxin-antitoxin system HicA family toxin [Candidatus Ozemobacteraceae bacterium]
MKSAEILKRLREDGWYLATTKGSHHQFKHLTKPGKVTVKHPSKDFPLSTLRSIYRQAGWKRR